MSIDLGIIILEGTSVSDNLSNFDLWKTILDYLWVPIVIPLVPWVIKKILPRFVFVKEIKKPNDPDIDGFKRLYNKRINETVRIDVEEILKFIDEGSRKSVSHHLLVCKHDGNVVGFIKYMISNELKKIFMAYIAIDNEDAIARKYGVNAMLNKIVKKYVRKKKPFSVIIETEQGKNGTYNTSLAKTVARRASGYKYFTYYLDVPYIQPLMPDCESEVVEECFLSLLLVSKSEIAPEIMSKDDYLRLVEFVYYNIYAPSCNSTKCNCKKYNEYLEMLIENYRKDSYEYINLILLGKGRK